MPAATASIRDQLRRLDFLDGLTDTALHQLSHRVTPASYTTDQVLFTEGQARTFLAVLVTGAVAVEKTISGRHVRLATLGPGEAVGEGLLLDDSPHGTSARAIQPTEAFVIGAEQVREMLKEQPALYAALVARAARTISARLRAADATLVGRGRALGFGGLGARTESDLLGAREVPEDALYGVQTLR